MASKQTYECFTCKNNGFAAVMVYLAGKDPQGRAIRLEGDGITMHTHKTKVPSQQQKQMEQHIQQFQTTDPMPLLRTMDAKLDRLISVLLSKESAKQS